MRKLLFLAHRIPYPPNKGDKIRSYHLLVHLAKYYQVYLGAFIDSEEDWQYVDKVNTICKKTYFSKLSPFKAKLKSFFGFINKQPLTLPYYQNNGFQNWVDDVLQKEDISCVLVFSSAMAQYISEKRHKNLYRVIDFVDIDSDKWRQYSEKKSWPMNWVYKRESNYLKEYEKITATEFNLSYFVSKSEAELFKQILPEHKNKIRYFNNGVDTEYYTPDINFSNPYQKSEKVLLFTGAMDYWANVDAVRWFAKDVFPLISEKVSAARFYIVGSNPDDQVTSLASDSIKITGTVPDVRPYIAHSHIVVAPLRIARGIQNKVLEALAMAKPVLATTQAYEGIEYFDKLFGQICDDPISMATYCIDMLSKDAEDSHGDDNRQFIIENFNWETNLNILSQSLI